jgi:hypothetical protein
MRTGQASSINVSNCTVTTCKYRLADNFAVDGAPEFVGSRDNQTAGWQTL